ncbi:MAG: ERCC4 domain-containing protein [Haloarculaceae archaeon]
MTVSLVVDDREPPGLADAFRAHPDVAAVAVRRLDAGDVVVADRASTHGGEPTGDATPAVGFERKTPGDYAWSAIGRAGTDLESQVRRLGDACDHAYVLLEGSFADAEAARPGVDPTAIRGTVASITARFGCPVLACGDRERLVDLAVRLARKHREPPGRRGLSPGAVPDGREPVAKRMYGCVEGIGPGTAAALYAAFPTVADLAEATRDELLSVEGVGPARADAVRAAIHGVDDACGDDPGGGPVR